MKIALCAPVDILTLARSCGRSTVGVASGLGSTATTPLIIKMLERGHEVTVYTLSDMSSAKSETYHWDNLRIIVVPRRSGRVPRYFPHKEILGMKRAIVADNPPFVHAHWTYEFALAALAARRPTLVTIHDLPWNVLRYFRDPYRAMRLMTAYLVAFRGRHFSAVSEDAANHFRRYLKPGTTIVVIPNGLPDLAFQAPSILESTVREHCVFATVLQGWSLRKNPTAALTAFAAVRRHLANAEMVMFGVDYQEGGPAQVWASEHKLDGAVRFAGPLAHEQLLERIRKGVDVIVHPSLDEALSVTAMEALVMRKPIVAGRDTAGMRELLGNGEAGDLVDVTDPKSISAAMLRLAKDMPYRERLVDAGYRRASSLYRLDMISEQYESLYRDIEAKR